MAKGGPKQTAQAASCAMHQHAHVAWIEIHQFSYLVGTQLLNVPQPKRFGLLRRQFRQGSADLLVQFLALGSRVRRIGRRLSERKLIEVLG